MTRYANWWRKDRVLPQRNWRTTLQLDSLYISIQDIVHLEAVLWPGTVLSQT